MAVSVSLLAILRGFRKPDGILIHYPVLSIAKRFMPSNLLCLDDEILS